MRFVLNSIAREGFVHRQSAQHLAEAVEEVG